MNGKLSLFFFLKSISKKIPNFIDPLIFPQHVIKKCQNFREKFCWTGANFYHTILLYHRLYCLNIYGLINISKLENNSVYFSHFSNHGINFISNLVDINGKYESWDAIKYEYSLTNKEKFWWLQLLHAIPQLWVEALNTELRLPINLPIYDHNLIKNCQLYTLDRLVSKELHNISLCSMYEKPTSQSYYEKVLETNLNWKEI